MAQRHDRGVLWFVAARSPGENPERSRGYIESLSVYTTLPTTVGHSAQANTPYRPLQHVRIAATHMHAQTLVASNPGVSQSKSSCLYIVDSKKNVVPGAEIVDNVHAKIARIWLVQDISALAKANGYKGGIPKLKAHPGNLAAVGAGEGVRQQTTRVVACRSMTVLTTENEPAQKVRVLGTTSHCVTKDVTSYDTATPPTSGTARKTPDTESVCLGLLIPIDSDKPDEIIKGSPPINEE
uniref:Uncharacterized protein n=1 Tax=Glossina pallidipes TaxID=7398 RepID=A0A1B0A0L4_GLOPL